MTVTAEPTTESVPVTNPHRIPTAITGWAVIAVFIGAMWGAGHHPDDAGISAAMVLLMIGIYLFNKARKLAFDRRHGSGK